MRMVMNGEKIRIWKEPHGVISQKMIIIKEQAVHCSETLFSICMRKGGIQ
jgi:hypothetical protein